MLRALIFDFDFTLGDSASGIVLCANDALRRLGYAELPPETIKPTIGLSLKNTYSVLTGQHNDEEATRFSDYFHDMAELVMVKHTELYPGVLQNLRLARKKGLLTAIVTTKHHRRIDQILAKFDASELIDVVVGVEDVKAEKPAPEGLLFAIDKLGVRREEILYVGDSLVDAQTAQAAAVPFAAVLTGTTAAEAFAPYPRRMLLKDVSEVFSRVFSAL